MDAMAAAFALALLAEPERAAAAEHLLCPAVTALLADGEPRRVLIGWEKPAPMSKQQAEAWAKSPLPPPPRERNLFAKVTAAPDDEAAGAFRAVTARITHYWSFERLAGSFVECLRAEGFKQERMTAAGSDIRAELVGRRRRRVVVEASLAACATAPEELERDWSCLLIEAQGR